MAVKEESKLSTTTVYCGKGSGKPIVSIIVPIKRREDISALLASIEASDYQYIETIVVDEGLERSAQRNIGIKKAQGIYLFIVDSDWVLKPLLLSECVRAMHEYDALYIPETIVTTGKFAKLRNWERQFYTATPIDVVRFVRAKECPLFDETISGPEDSDWDRRIKGKRGITTCDYYHHDKVDITQFLQKKAYYSKSMKAFEDKHKGDKVLNPWWRCVGVFIENGKWRRLICHPILTALMFIIVVVRGVVYLWNRRY